MTSGDAPSISGGQFGPRVEGLRAYVLRAVPRWAVPRSIPPAPDGLLALPAQLALPVPHALATVNGNAAGK